MVPRPKEMTAKAWERRAIAPTQTPKLHSQYNTDELAPASGPAQSCRVAPHNNAARINRPLASRCWVEICRAIQGKPGMEKGLASAMPRPERHHRKLPVPPLSTIAKTQSPNWSDRGQPSHWAATKNNAPKPTNKNPTPNSTVK